MKLLITLVAVLAMATLVDAKGTSGSGGGYTGSSGQQAPKGGRGGQNGITGTIGEVGGSSFTLVVQQKDESTVTYIVKCDGNTKFLSGKEPASPAIVKAGAHVNVQGGQNNHDMNAYTVTLTEGKK